MLNNAINMDNIIDCTIEDFWCCSTLDHSTHVTECNLVDFLYPAGLQIFMF